MIFYIILLFFLLFFFASILRIVPEYERGVVLRLGRCIGAKGPGIIILLPMGIDRIIKISLRTVTLDVPSQDVITKDNISVKVNAVVYFRVVDPVKAILNVENYHYATSQLAQTTLRSVCGQVELDKLLAERERINEELQKILDVQTESWGVKVMNVELKQIDLPQEMQRAMARQAEAERERRAKIINAEGELQAANMLSEASDILARNPMTLQLRYLQTLTEISSEKNTTIVFPIPIDVLSGLMKKDK
ncbi:MAG: slipin family protein [Proteobacteria bacterium]|nr:slipin family protein [Pseudomonadota bacterium]